MSTKRKPAKWAPTKTPPTVTVTLTWDGAGELLNASSVIVNQTRELLGKDRLMVLLLASNEIAKARFEALCALERGDRNA